MLGDEKSMDRGDLVMSALANGVKAEAATKPADRERFEQAAKDDIAKLAELMEESA